MSGNCKFFESITKKWFYCADKEEFIKKEDESFCEKCQYKPKEIVVIQ